MDVTNEIYTEHRINTVKVVSYFNYLDRNCIIVTNQGMFPCAYVELKGKERDLDNSDLDCILNVYGGVTWCGTLHHLIKSNPTVPESILTREYVGWDYGHCFDYIKHLDIGTQEWNTVHTIEEIEMHCKEAISQLNKKICDNKER